eukprot:EG_transcript_8732
MAKVLSANDEGLDFSIKGHWEDFLARLSECPDVHILDLSASHFCWRHVKPLCEAISNQGHITDLNVSDNELSHFDGLQYLVEYLRQNPSPSIHALNIGGSDMDEEAVLSFCESIVENPVLRQLNLDSNRPFTPIAIHAVTSLVINMANLTDLSLADVLLDADGVRVLSEAVMHTPTLEHLNLAMNYFPWEAGIYLGEMLSINKRLKRLDVSSNRLQGEGVAELLCAAALGNTALASLNLSRNFCQGIDHIAGLPSHLTILNVSVNNLNVPGAVKLSYLLHDPACKLQLLYLQQNLIGDNGVCVIADALNDNVQLQLLDLSKNCVTIEGVMYLVAMLTVNTTLRRLHLADHEKIDDNAWSLIENHSEQFWGLHFLDLHGTMVSKKGPVRLRAGRLLVTFSEDEDEEEEEEEEQERDEPFWHAPPTSDPSANELETRSPKH